jgi:hypothetical protein
VIGLFGEGAAEEGAIAAARAFRGEGGAVGLAVRAVVPFGDRRVGVVLV